MRYALFGIFGIGILASLACSAQDQQAPSAQTSPSSTTDKIINFPTKLFSRIQGKTASLDQQLTRQTEKYLQRMAGREARLQKKLYKVDSAAAKRLFANSAQQYAALRQKMKSDTGGHKDIPLSGEYQPYTDSLKGSLSYLRQNPQLLKDSGQSRALQSSVTQLQQLQAKIGDADEARAFIQQRKQEINTYISQHANLQNLLTSEYQQLSQHSYYYSQQVNQYKQMLNDPDQLEKKALSLLDQLPPFQQFMKNNSQLAGLFNLPSNYGSPTALAGLQTRDQVSQMIQSQLASGGPGASAALTSNLQAAGQGLDQYKQKLSQLGSGSGDIDMPDFKPNNQKTKTFWKRLQLGTDLQTTRTNYYWPTMTAIGLSVGYKLTDKSTIGLGASYEIGWGAGINHIALSGQGAGLRSFIDIKIKGTWSATGGLEYNYTTPINSLQQISNLGDWTQSGLIGGSKTIAVKNRFFKQTKLQLLWDFLSYQQIPKTEPILFRVGYGF
jgi:uncharacterized membrane-anchored protein YhcB (DUF1043 family)